MTSDSLRELEERLRGVEQITTKLTTQVEPLLSLAPAMASLSTQISDLKGSLATLRGQALLLGALATFVSPILCGIVLKVILR